MTQKIKKQWRPRDPETRQIMPKYIKKSSSKALLRELWNLILEEKVVLPKEFVEKLKKTRELEKEKIKEYSKKYYLKNKEKMAKKAQEWRKKNLERAKELGRFRYSQNKERILELHKKWRDKRKVKNAS